MNLVFNLVANLLFPSPLRASGAVNGVGRDLVAAGDSVPGVCGCLSSVDLRPLHVACVAPDVVLFVDVVPVHAQVGVSAVRAGFELGAIHRCLPHLHLQKVPTDEQRLFRYHLPSSPYQLCRWLALKYH